MFFNALLLLFTMLISISYDTETASNLVARSWSLIPSNLQLISYSQYDILSFDYRK